MAVTWRWTASVPGAPEAEVTEAELESDEAELEKAKLQFSGLLAGLGERATAIID